MSQNFVQQIDRLRRRLQRRRVLAASCWAIATIAMAALVLMALDRLLGIGDLWGRAVCTASLVGVGWMVGRRWFAAALCQPVSSLEIALRVEQRHPKLRDLVTSALDFSQQTRNAPYAGSESLRRSVVLRADAELENIDWHPLVPRQPLQRAMLAVGGVLLLFSLALWWTPKAIGVGLARLLNPLNTAEWPSVFHLAFVDPPKILAAGDNLVLQLRDTRGQLPHSVDMHYRVWRDQRWNEQIDPLTVTGTSQEILRPHVQQSMEYRATGGDHHTMPWQKLEVVARPKIKNLQLRVYPPDYTGLPSRPLGNNRRVLAGSQLEVTGQSDQQLTTVLLRGEGATRPATLDPTGKRFFVAKDDWRAEASELVYFDLTTATGLTARATQRLALEVVPDHPPQVRFLAPTGDLTVTPAAIVPVRVVADDDLAIRDLELVYRRTDRSEAGDQRVSLFRGPKTSPTTPQSRHQQLEHLWQLESLSLAPGTVVEVHARASDYRSGVGQTSYPLRLIVVPLEGLLRHISEENLNLLETLNQLLQEQRALRKRVASWNSAPSTTAQRWPEEVRIVLSRQRQLSDALSNPHNGIIRSLQELVEVYSRNRLDRHALVEPLRSQIKLLRTVVDQPLTNIDRQLRALMRRAKQSDSNAAILQRQEEVLAALQQAIDSLALNSELARFESKLAAIETEQQELANQRQSPKGGRQRKLARRFAKLISQMTRAIDKQSANAKCLSDTVTLARTLGVQATMRAAADHLAQQQIGQAAMRQQEALQHLQKLRRRLAEGRLGKQAKTEPRQQQAPSKPEGAGKAGTKPRSTTSPRAHGQRDFSEDAAAAGQLVKDLWGNLPERQREQILQPLGEKFLPKYAEEIKAYFRALAEPDKTNQDQP